MSRFVGKAAKSITRAYGRAIAANAESRSIVVRNGRRVVARKRQASYSLLKCTTVRGDYCPRFAGQYWVSNKGERVAWMRNNQQLSHLSILLPYDGQTLLTRECLLRLCVEIYPDASWTGAFEGGTIIPLNAGGVRFIHERDESPRPYGLVLNARRSGQIGLTSFSGGGHVVGTIKGRAPQMSVTRAATGGATGGATAWGAATGGSGCVGDIAARLPRSKRQPKRRRLVRAAEYTEEDDEDEPYFGSE